MTYPTTQPLRSHPATLISTPLRHDGRNLARLLFEPRIAMIHINNPAMTLQQAAPSATNTCASHQKQLAPALPSIVQQLSHGPSVLSDARCCSPIAMPSLARLSPFGGGSGDTAASFFCASSSHAEVRGEDLVEGNGSSASLALASGCRGRISDRGHRRGITGVTTHQHPAA